MSIKDNISQINQIVIDEKIPINSIIPIIPHSFDSSFDSSYYSRHTTVSAKEAEIYHLMLDFSSKINPKKY